MQLKLSKWSVRWKQREPESWFSQELCITAYTCGDLFWQENLLEEAKVQLMRIAEETADVDAIIFVGLPLEYKGKLYNVAAGLNHGEILGFVP